MKQAVAALAVIAIVVTATLLFSNTSSNEIAISSHPNYVQVETSVPDIKEFDMAIISQVKKSTVAIKGSDCPRFQFGSGFSLKSGTVVTSAHVVAGIRNPIVVINESSEEIEATVIAFDPVRDLAILDIGSHEMPGLEISKATDGENVALIGYDKNGVTDWRPGQVTQHIRATGSDIYGEPGSGRDALILAMDVDSGHSGSPVVNNSGEVIGVAFSSVKGGGATAYAVQTNELNNLVDETQENSEAIITQCR